MRNLCSRSGPVMSSLSRFTLTNPDCTCTVLAHPPRIPFFTGNSTTRTSPAARTGQLRAGGEGSVTSTRSARCLSLPETARDEPGDAACARRSLRRGTLLLGRCPRRHEERLPCAADRSAWTGDHAFRRVVYEV